MNNIQNYGWVNVNANYGKENRSPNFKALIYTKAAKKNLSLAKDIINKIPTNMIEIGKRNSIINTVERIEKIQPFADASKFFDLVLDYNEGIAGDRGFFFGIKPIGAKIADMIEEISSAKGKGNKLNLWGPTKTVTVEVKDSKTAQSFREKLTILYNLRHRTDKTDTFIDLYRAIEEYAQLRAKKAIEFIEKNK